MLKHILNKCDKYVFLKIKKNTDKVNELSFTYNFDHILSYVMCKFHVSTIFH